MAATPQTLSAFFKVAFAKGSGYVCIAAIPPGMKGIEERFFLWPEQHDQMLQHILVNQGAYNMYFCPQLLDRPTRKKEKVRYCTTAWADLDSCTPDKLLLDPTMVIQSSEGRFQALWSFEDTVPPDDGEAVSRRIAYFHAHHGADQSGWDLSQLLRVPGTSNFKYNPPQEVQLLAINSGFR